jgi:HD-like signal output (HDOD) protein
LAEEHPKDLEYWVNRLSHQDMPIFARTAELITGVVARRESSVAELSRGILQDASMTARILKMANSVFYNSSSCDINTITRAIMVLGFETVRSMCLSINLIESILKGTQQERAYQEMARSFHAAMQAKRFAVACRDESPEEIFVTTLLFRLGHIAFWCFAGEFADRLEQAMLKPGYTEAMAEQEVLGFRLQQLTQRLSQEWHLSKMLQSALESTGVTSSRASLICMAHKVAAAAEQGWETREFRRLTAKVGELLKVSPDAATTMMHTSARDATEMVENYGGMRKFIQLIPVPPEPLGSSAPSVSPETARRPGPCEPPAAEPHRRAEISPFPEPDRLLQFKVLHELSNLLLNKQLDINLLFSILLEGIFRGVGMDRVLFAILTPDRGHLKGKFGLGWKSQDQVKDFLVEAGPEPQNIFGYALEKRQPLWVTSDPPQQLARLLTRGKRDPSGRPPFFLMAIRVKERSIGVVYADRQASGRELDEESFTSFKYFCQQADINLAYFAG